MSIIRKVQFASHGMVQSHADQIGKQILHCAIRNGEGSQAGPRQVPRLTCLWKWAPRASGLGTPNRQGRADQDMKQKCKVILPIREQTQFSVFMVLLFLELDFLGYFKT